MHRLRNWAYATATLSIIGVVILAIGDDFTIGMLWLLTPALLAGLVLSPRFYPLELVGAAATARMNAAWKRTFIDIGWLAGGYLVVLLGWAVAVQFIEPDGSAFGLAPLLAVFCGGAALLGTLVGMLTVLPIITLVEQSRLATRRGAVNLGAVAGAILLLSVITFAISVVAATSIEGGSGRSRGLLALLVVVTGVETDDAQITSQPMAWVARVSLLGIILSGIALYRLSRRRRPPRSDVSGNDD